MGRHEDRRRVWLITPLLFFVLMAIFFGATSLRAHHAASMFSGPTAIADATVLGYEEPSLTSHLFSKVAEGYFFVRFRAETGDDVEAKVRAVLCGSPERHGDVLRVEYVRAHPDRVRLIRGAGEAKDDANFYGALAALSLVVVAALTAFGWLAGRTADRG